MNTRSCKSAYALLVFLIILMHVSAFGMLVLNKNIVYTKILINLEKINEDLGEEKEIIETVKGSLLNNKKLPSSVNGHELVIRDDHSICVYLQGHLLELIHDEEQIISYGYRY